MDTTSPVLDDASAATPRVRATGAADDAREAARPMTFETRLFEGRAGLAELAPEWRRLTATLASKRYFHVAGWHECWLDSLEPDPGSVVYCAFYGGGELAAVVPLQRTTRRVAGLRLRCLELLQHEHVWLSDVVVGDRWKDVLTAADVVRALRSRRELRWDLIVAQRTLSDSALARICASGAPRLSLRRRQTESAEVAIEPYDRLLKGLPRHFRKNLRNAANRLAALGDAAYVSAAGAESADALDEFAAVESSGWKGGAGTGTAIGLDANAARFYRALTTRFVGEGSCEVHLLRLGGRAIGGLFVVRCGDTAYLYKVGYDETFGRVSPVHLLIEHLLQRYAAAGDVRTLSFVTRAAWCDVWNTRRTGVDNRYFFRPGPVGVAAFLAMNAQQWLKERKAPAPPPVAAAAQRTEEP